MAKTTQRLLTIRCGRPMQTFIEQQTNGARVISICPHYNEAAMLIGYLVVVEDGPLVPSFRADVDADVTMNEREALQSLIGDLCRQWALDGDRSALTRVLRRHAPDHDALNALVEDGSSPVVLFPWALAVDGGTPVASTERQSQATTKETSR